MRADVQRRQPRAIDPEYHTQVRLDQFATLRKETGALMDNIDDYLNWCEATQSQTRSGTFAEYLKATGKSDDSEPRRRDPIYVYLDVLEAQFQ